MEHEMRLAVIPRGVPGPMIMPYCIGCGWVGIRYALDSFRSVPDAWRIHIKEFNESEAERIMVWLEHRRASTEDLMFAKHLNEARADDGDVSHG